MRCVENPENIPEEKRRPIEVRIINKQRLYVVCPRNLRITVLKQKLEAWITEKLASTFEHSFEFKMNIIANLKENIEGHLESIERFAIQRYLLIIGKKQNMQVLSHTFTYFST